MGIGGKVILGFAGDVEFAGKDFRRITHDEAGKRIGQPELQPDAWLKIGEVETGGSGELLTR